MRPKRKPWKQTSKMGPNPNLYQRRYHGKFLTSKMKRKYLMIFKQETSIRRENLKRILRINSKISLNSRCIFTNKLLTIKNTWNAEIIIKKRRPSELFLPRTTRKWSRNLAKLQRKDSLIHHTDRTRTQRHSRSHSLSATKHTSSNWSRIS